MLETFWAICGYEYTSLWLVVACSSLKPRASKSGPIENRAFLNDIFDGSNFKRADLSLEIEKIFKIEAVNVFEICQILKLIYMFAETNICL